MLTLFLGAALARDVDCFMLTADLPDPGAAVGLSALVGLGSGHIYAGRGGAAVPWAVVDAVAYGLLLSGSSAFTPNATQSTSTDPEIVAAEAEETASKIEAWQNRRTIGASLLVGSRTLQAAAVSGAVHEQRREAVERCGAAGSAPSPTLAADQARRVTSTLNHATVELAWKELGLNQYSLEAPAVEAWVEEQLRTGAMASDVIRRIKAGDSPFSLPAKPEEPAPGAGQP